MCSDAESNVKRVGELRPCCTCSIVFESILISHGAPGFKNSLLMNKQMSYVNNTYQQFLVNFLLPITLTHKFLRLYVEFARLPFVSNHSH